MRRQHAARRASAGERPRPDAVTALHAAAETLGSRVRQLSESQQREMLLQKVKADNSEIAEAERRLSEHQEAVRRGRGQLSQLSNEIR